MLVKELVDLLNHQPPNATVGVDVSQFISTAATVGAGADAAARLAAMKAAGLDKVWFGILGVLSGSGGANSEVAVRVNSSASTKLPGPG